MRIGNIERPFRTVVLCIAFAIVGCGAAAAESTDSTGLSISVVNSGTQTPAATVTPDATTTPATSPTPTAPGGIVQTPGPVTSLPTTGSTPDGGQATAPTLLLLVAGVALIGGGTALRRRER